MPSLKGRLTKLEQQTVNPSEDGGSSACPRCTATLIVIRDAITEKVFSAKALPGGELSPEELHERETEEYCARCGRARDSSWSSVIKIGGTP